MKKRIAILQSNYIPWRGYFDIIGSVDEFLIYDSAQYIPRLRELAKKTACQTGAEGFFSAP